MHPRTLEAVVLHGILQDASGENIPLRFNKATPEEVTPWKEESPVSPDDANKNITVIPAMDLPPPHDLVLEMSLGEKLGTGDVGFVYGAAPILGGSTSPALCQQSMTVPPLAVKIAGRARKVALDREAWFYNDLQCLQGSVIPRFYGYFEAVVPPDAVYTHWSTDKHWESRDSTAGLSRRPATDSEASEPEPYDAPYIKEDRVVSDKISILLLERLSGEFLPLYYRFNADEEREIKVLYEELAGMRVEHYDVRHSHIVRVLDSPPGLPPMATPAQKSQSRYRLIDFQHALKTADRTWAWSHMSDWTNVQVLLENLVTSRVYELRDLPP